MEQSSSPRQARGRRFVAVTVAVLSVAGMSGCRAPVPHAVAWSCPAPVSNDPHPQVRWALPGSFSVAPVGDARRVRKMLAELGKRDEGSVVPVRATLADVCSRGGDQMLLQEPYEDGSSMVVITAWPTGPTAAAYAKALSSRALEGSSKGVAVNGRNYTVMRFESTDGSGFRYVSRAPRTSRIFTVALTLVNVDAKERAREAEVFGRFVSAATWAEAKQAQ